MNLSTKQSQALNFCIDFLHEVKWLKIDCIVLYGSATYPGCYIEDISDLDILIISENAKSSELTELAQKLSAELPHDTNLKPPVVLQDHIGNRIEFGLSYENILIDCTIMETLINSSANMLSDIVRDSAELLIGSMVIWGIPIYGSIRDYIVPDLNLFPYYDDSIRCQRLMSIEDYLSSKVKRIEFMLGTEDIAVVDYFFRYRPVFLKWVFCYYRQYPVNYYKHLPMQLSWVKDLLPIEKTTILLNSKKTIREDIAQFINFYKNLLDKFHHENH